MINKHAAIAVRNSLLQLFPKDLVEEAIKIIRSNLLANVNKEDPKIALAKSLTYFSEKGVSTQNLEAFLEMPQKDWAADEVIELRGLATSITEGNYSIAELKKLTLPTQQPTLEKPIKVNTDALQQKLV